VRLIGHAPVRLILIVRLYGKNYYLHGAIPVAFHWVLALFVLVTADVRPVAPSGTGSRR
jgi:hypothetical protein